MNRPLLLVALGALAGSVEAQTDEDIFADGAFDQAVSAGQASEDANKLAWLGGVSLASVTVLTVPADRGGYGSTSLMTGKGFLKASRPQVGALFVSYSFTHTLWAASDDAVLTSAYGRLKEDPDSPDFQLSEAHLSFDLGKTVFLRLGSQLLDWGASAVWSPADFINRRTSDPNAPVDTRTGKPGLRIHVPWAGGNLFVFADASRSLTASGSPRDLVETGSVGLKTDTTLAGWNLGLVGNFGRNDDARTGLTASGAVLGVDLWGEGAASWKREGLSTWSASLGGEKSFGTDSEWTLRAEGFWNPSGEGDTPVTGAALGRFQSLYWGQAYVYAEAVKKKLWGPDVTGSLSGTANLADRSYTATASLRTAFPGTVPLSFYTQYNGGAADREFTLAAGGPAWTFGLRSLVEF